MKVARAEKILLSLFLCAGLVGCAHAELKYATASNSQTTVTYTDAEGDERTYEYSGVAATTSASLSGLQYSSQSGGSNTSYYAWTSDGLVQVTSASSADVAVNWTKSSAYPKGIFNDGSDSSLQGKNISGDFVNNNVGNGGYDNVGGAIENIAGYTQYESDKYFYNAKLGNITGNFVGNYVILTPGEEEESYPAAGGAIFNYATGDYSATIGNITGNFIGNSATGTATGNSNGGAIFNEGNSGSTATIGNITGDFVGNSAIDNGTEDSDATPTAAGGAIYNYAYGEGAKATIGDIVGNFYGNSAQAYGSANSHGGAINNLAGGDSSSDGDEAKIGNITGDFIGNYATSQNKAAWGGAILNMAVENEGTATIGNITGDFLSNYVSAAHNAYGGAIHNRAGGEGNTTTATIGDINGRLRRKLCRIRRRFIHRRNIRRLRRRDRQLCDR